jgi:hypothetical protein
MNGFARGSQIGFLMVTIAFTSIGAPRGYGSGPGVAADFVVLSDGFTSIASSNVKGDVGGRTVQLTDNARVNGNTIAAASSGVVLDLGDNARVVRKCVTGGGSISIVPAHPAKCLGGQDTSGSDPLLTELGSGISDAGTLAGALSALTPTLSLGEIDLLSGTKETMKFPSGTSVVAVTTRMLIESESVLTIKASPVSSVIFLVGTLFTTQSHARIVLAGGIKANNVAYVVNNDVTLGSNSSVMGTMIAPSGNCMLDDMSRFKGALLCGSS